MHIQRLLVGLVVHHLFIVLAPPEACRACRLMNRFCLDSYVQAAVVSVSSNSYPNLYYTTAATTGNFQN